MSSGCIDPVLSVQLGCDLVLGDLRSARTYRVIADAASCGLVAGDLAGGSGGGGNECEL